MMDPSAPHKFNKWLFDRAYNEDNKITVSMFRGEPKIVMSIKDLELRANVRDWAEGKFENIQTWGSRSLHFDIPGDMTLTDFLIELDNLLDLLNTPQ